MSTETCAGCRCRGTDSDISQSGLTLTRHQLQPVAIAIATARPTETDHPLHDVRCRRGQETDLREHTAAVVTARAVRPPDTLLQPGQAAPGDARAGSEPRLGSLPVSRRVPHAGKITRAAPDVRARTGDGRAHRLLRLRQRLVVGVDTARSPSSRRLLAASAARRSMLQLPHAAERDDLESVRRDVASSPRHVVHEHRT